MVKVLLEKRREESDFHHQMDHKFERKSNRQTDQKSREKWFQYDHAVRRMSIDDIICMDDRE
jgi:hypothetical protein